MAFRAFLLNSSLGRATDAIVQIVSLGFAALASSRDQWLAPLLIVYTYSSILHPLLTALGAEPHKGNNDQSSFPNTWVAIVTPCRGTPDPGEDLGLPNPTLGLNAQPPPAGGGPF